VIDYSQGFQLTLFVGLLLALSWLVGTLLVRFLEVKGKNFLNSLTDPMEQLACAVLRTTPQKWAERQGMYLFPGRLQLCQLRPVFVQPTLHKKLRRNP
jgi:hypothetical protein